MNSSFRHAVMILLLGAASALPAQPAAPMSASSPTLPPAPGRQFDAPERPAAVFTLGAPALSRAVSSLPTIGDTAKAAGLEPRLSGPQTTSVTSFDGITRSLTATATPDIIGDVSPDFYVQAAAGTAFVVFDRSGAILSGPSLLRDLWPPGTCNPSDRGHPSVVWDPLTERWFISHLGYATSICIAVSTTPDPRGTYYLYDFNIGAPIDSSELGVWRDALLIAIAAPQTYVFAVEKVKMISGEFARAVGGYGPAGGSGRPVPVSFSGGPLPPSDQSPLFLSRVPPSVDRPTGAFVLTRVTFGSWTIGTASVGEAWSATGAEVGATADLACGSPGSGCIVQPGTATQLWAEDPPTRATARYRRFDTVQRVVAAVSVPTDSPVRPAVVWFELSAPWPEKTWSLSGHGASLADGAGRWLGAAAINSAGEIGLEYSVSSAVITPSLRFAVWPRAVITGAASGEEVLWTGAGAQTLGSAWNDRAGLSVDPADGCGFWTTGAYLGASGATEWHSRVGRFASAACQPVTYALRIWPDKANACVDTPFVFAGQAITASLTAPISLSVEVLTPTMPLTVVFGQPPIALDAPFSMPFTVTFPASNPAGPALVGLLGAGSGSFTATADMTLWKPITASPAPIVAAVDRVPFGVVPASSGLTSTATITYGLNFGWTAVPNSGGYLLEVAPDAGFSTILLSQTIQASQAAVRLRLAPLTTYYWRVRSVNTCGSGPVASGNFKTLAYTWLPALRR